MATVRQLQESLDIVKAHNNKRLDEIRLKIELRRREGLNSSDLEKELEQAGTTAMRGEDLAERRLKAAQAIEAEQARLNAERKKAAADQITAKQKKQAFRTYLANGGTADEFEKVWPGIREKVLAESAADQITGKAGPVTETIIKSL